MRRAVHTLRRLRFCISGAAAQYGGTALIGAARFGHADCARLLLDAGADKEAKDNVRARAGRGALMCVASVAIFSRHRFFPRDSNHFSVDTLFLKMLHI